MDINKLTSEQKEFYEERAAIAEYDAGLSRYIAEQEAIRITRKFFGLIDAD